MSNSPKTHQMPPELLLDLPSLTEMQALVNEMVSNILEYLFNKYILYPYRYHRAIKNISRIIDSAALYGKYRLYVSIPQSQYRCYYLIKTI